MSESRKKILEMVADGRISVEEAAQLLAKVESAIDMIPPSPDPEPAPAPPRPPSRPPAPRFLRVVVDGGSDRVNVKLPMSLLKAGIKLSALLPDSANEAVEEHGINLSNLASLDSAELIEALAELEVTVDGEDGEKVRIFCE
ncbi:hypothetical protein JW905_01850 [bacterium]|nr:hypothetical protein [candidate division CSSED10-310 bacterium]